MGCQSKSEILSSLHIFEDQLCFSDYNDVVNKLKSHIDKCKNKICRDSYKGFIDRLSQQELDLLQLNYGKLDFLIPEFKKAIRILKIHGWDQYQFDSTDVKFLDIVEKSDYSLTKAELFDLRHKYDLVTNYVNQVTIDAQIEEKRLKQAIDVNSLDDIKKHYIDAKKYFKIG